MNSKHELQAYEAGQRAAAAHAYRKANEYIAACDDIIADIEWAHGDHAMDALTRKRYGDALVMRSQALTRLTSPSVVPSVVAATEEALETAQLAHTAAVILGEIWHLPPDSML